MLKYLHIVLLVIATNISFGQIKVTVLEKESGKPAPLLYVNVYSEPGHALLYDKTQQTNDSGIANVTIDKCPCTIEISGQGYETLKQYIPSNPGTKELAFTVTKNYNALNEVVVTGVTQPQRLKDALSLYQVIPKAAIQSQGAVSLDDVLQKQLNITVSEDNILGPSAGMLGMGGNKLKILIDGMAVNGRENGNINLRQINLNNAERIEIIQGPMSVVYGSDAIAGVINIITKTIDKPFHLEVGTYYQSIGKYNADASISFRAKKRSQFTFGLGRNFFQGYKYIDTTWSHLSVPNTDIHRQYLYLPIEQYLANAAYKYTAPSGFTLNFASDFLRETVINKGPIHTWDAFRCYAFDSYYYTTRLMNRLSLSGKLGKTGSWLSQNSLMYYNNTRRQYSYDLVTLTGMPTQGLGDQDTSTFYDITSRSSYTNKFHHLSYTIGYDISAELAHSNKINGSEKSIDDYAAFTVLSYPLINNLLTVQGAARASYNTTYKVPLTPSFNLLFTPLNNLQIRASYSQGFRAPSLKEMYLSFIDANHHIIGNTNLQAERSNSFQLSGSYQVYERGNDYMQLSLSGYYNNVRNGIVLVNVNPLDSNSIDYVYNNMTRQRNTISTFQMDGQANGFHYQLGYSYKYVLAEPGKYASFNVNEINAMLQYMWRKPHIGFNIFYKYTGPQPFLTTAITGDATYSGLQYAYHYCDASVEKKFFRKRLQVVAGVKNIFDITQLKTSGVISTGPHNSGVSGNFLPRSFFTSLRLSID